MLRKMLILVMIAAVALLAVGCSENATEPEVTSQLNLEDEFGGYTATSETPGFGDPELLNSLEDEVEFNDPLASSPEIQALEEDPTSGVFRFRAVWGQLCYNAEQTTLTDFSGSLTVTRGGVLIRRVIRFEVGQDYIVPRTERTLLEWVSQTSVHNDGIAVDIIVPDVIPDEASTDPAPEPVEVTFTAGAYSRTFTLGEIASLDTVVTLDDGNEIAFIAHQYSRCPRGILAGHWGQDEAGDNVFRGRWISQIGRVIGYLEGHYGVNDQGQRVFFGKWITADGEFEGFLRGTYGERLFGNANRQSRPIIAGYFAGKIYDANEMEIGVLAGHFVGSAILQEGFFHGRWKLNCPAAGDQQQDRDQVRDGQMDDGM